ncbi:hypothetical protein V1264_003219 [Littorina saxatilis]|uniref:Sulfatase N-terminal domain-containing protein n=1 Tax=Littorina saxatilis TaxID=31220 RepID=A0AAN9B487_9CAEN
MPMMSGKMMSSLLAAMLMVVVPRFNGVNAADKPHILFIVADDLGWNDVVWRDPTMHTPTLSRMARQGILLNSYYVQPLCSPSRSAFMSGYFPFHTGLQHGVIMPEQKAYLPANLTTLPQSLKDLGYATHAVGKWHLGFCNWKYTPTFRGFDSFLGYYNAAEDYYTHMAGRGYDFRQDTAVDKDDAGKYSAYTFAERAQVLIGQHNTSQPLFLYLAFQSVHGPLEVPAVYENVFCGHIQNETRRTKCGMVAILDEAIANITGHLEDTGLIDNMLIVFTTDNGGPVWDAGNNWPLRGAKATMWEGGTRGTAFVYSKNLFQNKGTVHKGMMHAVDWFPTMMTAAGGSPPPGIDGVSQWESLTTGSPSPRSEFVYNMDAIEDGQKPAFHAAIRSGDWKLMQGPAGMGPAGIPYNGWYPVPGVDGEQEEFDESAVEDPGPDDYQLFNIKEDPTEHHDVKDKYPDVLAKMKARLAEWRQTMVPANFPENDPAANPEHYGGTWTPGWC